MRVLLVGYGSSGGIGRYEVLLHNGLAALSSKHSLEFRSLFVGSFPDYLQEGLNPENQWQAGGHRTAFLVRLLRDVLFWRPDSVLFTHVYLAPIGLLARLTRPRLGYLVAVYGWEIWEKLPLLRALALRGSRRILAISHDTKERVRIDQGVPKSRIALLPPVLDASAFTPMPGSVTPDPAGSPAGPLILSVGRLASTERQKGFDTLIEALPHIRRVFPDVTYTVVGEGDDLPRLCDLVERLGVGEHVSFLGRLSNDAMRELYARCTLFALPSKQEGFGIVLLEAMAFGKPVIGGRHGGILDVVDHGRTGLLVEHGNVEELAAAIITLLSDPPRCWAMGQAGYQRVQTEFTFDRFIERLGAILNDLRDDRVVSCAE